MSEQTQVDVQTRNWAMWLHLSGLSGLFIPFGNLIGPLVIWLIKKDELPGLDQHGKNAVNWAISAIIYTIVAGISILVLIGFVLLPVIVILSIVFPIMAAMKANEGRLWKYPMTIPFIS